VIHIYKYKVNLYIRWTRFYPHLEPWFKEAFLPMKAPFIMLMQLYLFFDTHATISLGVINLGPIVLGILDDLEVK
jgi:hypothetical protein